MSELHKLSGSICSMVMSNTALQDEKGSRSLSPKFQKKKGKEDLSAKVGDVIPGLGGSHLPEQPSTTTEPVL